MDEVWRSGDQCSVGDLRGLWELSEDFRRAVEDTSLQRRSGLENRFGNGNIFILFRPINSL